MLPSANAHFAGNAGSLYSRNGLLWLSPYWLSAACRSRQILRDLSKIIQAGALLFEQHGELQIEGVGCLGQPGRYTGRSTDAKLRKIYCFVFYLNLFFCFLSLTSKSCGSPREQPRQTWGSIPFPHFSRWNSPARGEQLGRKGRWSAKKPSALPLGPGDRRSQEWKSCMHLPSQGANAPWAFARCLRKWKLSSFSLSIRIVRGALQLKTRWRFAPGKEGWSGGWGSCPCTITDGLSTVITKSWS